MRKKIAFLLLTACVLFSCSQTKQKESKKSPIAAARDSIIKMKNTPDSLKTPEQKRTLYLLEKTLILYTKVENNHLVFKLSREAFHKLGLPSIYYDVILQDLENDNRWIDSCNIKNVDSILKVSNVQRYEQINLKYEE